MAQRLRTAVAALAAALALTSLGAPRAQAQAVDLAGTWYVLVHYTDDTAHDPKQMRWEDRIWVFARKGAELEWKEYPIVVFQDESGRFERLGTNRSARVVAAWEPNPTQLAQIASGLEYNTRGAKEKTLKGSDASGWSSGQGAKAQGANVISYVETWTVDDPRGRPVFTRVDSMGSSEDDVAEGRTEFKTASVENGGAVLRGSFERDGTRHGTFRLMKSGDASITKGSGKTQEQRLREAFLSNMGAELFPTGQLDRFRELAKDSGASEGRRADLRKQVREEVVREFQARSLDVNSADSQYWIDRITDAAVSALTQGLTPEEIRARVAGEFKAD